MPEKFHVTRRASFHRRSYGIDEATKAGIGATLCSLVILASVLLSMHMLPVSIGHAAPPARLLSLQ